VASLGHLASRHGRRSGIRDAAAGSQGNAGRHPVLVGDGLDAVERGQSASDVRSRLGAPFHEFLLYEDGPDTCTAVRINGDVVAMAQPIDRCATRGVRAGQTRAAVLQALGAPRETCWVYSRPPNGGYFRARGVCFTDDRVRMVVRRWMRE